MSEFIITEAELPYIAIGVIGCLLFQLFSNILNLLVAFVHKFELDNDIKWFKNREIKKQLSKEKLEFKK